MTLRARAQMHYLVIAASVIAIGASTAAASTDIPSTALGAMMSQSNHRQTRTVALPPERVLVVEVTIGTVKIEGSDRADAEIVITRDAPSEAAFERIPVTIDESPTRVSVRALQSNGTTDPALRTGIVLRVPRTAVIERMQVLEGGVTFSNFNGQLTADVRRGSIEGTGVSGTLRLETGIGSVVLANARLSPTGLLRLRTFNGDVRLTLAERPADARILALALNGHIKSQIPLTMRDSWGPRWGEATLGRGEPVISIDVVTGTIDLKSPER